METTHWTSTRAPVAVKGINSHLLINEFFASSIYSTEDGRLPTEVVHDGGVVTNKDV